MVQESTSAPRRDPAGSKSRSKPVQNPPRAGRASEAVRDQPLVITRISSASVLRASLVFYFLAFLVAVVAMVILWQFFGASGYETKLNHLLDSLLGSATYHVIGFQVLVIFAGLGIVWVILSSIVTVIAVRIFSAVASLLGGITIYVRTREVSGR